MQKYTQIVLGFAVTLMLVILSKDMAAVTLGVHPKYQDNTSTPSPTIQSVHPLITVDNIKSLTRIAIPQGPDYWVTGVAFSPNNQLLAAVREGGDVFLWETETWKQIAMLSAGNSEMHSGNIQFSPNGEFIASVSNTDGNAVLLWNVQAILQTLKREPVSILRGTITSPITCVSFHPDGLTLATLDYDGNLSFWNIGTSSVVTSYHVGTIGPNCLSFSPDGKMLAFTTQEAIHLWNMESKRQTSEFQADTVTLAFSPDSSILAFERKSKLRLWDLKNNKDLFALESDNFTAISSIAFSPDGTIVAAGSAWYYMVIFDVNTGRKLHVVEDTGAISALAFSSDGTLIVTGHSGSGVKTWVTVWGIQ